MNGEKLGMSIKSASSFGSFFRNVDRPVRWQNSWNPTFTYWNWDFSGACVTFIVSAERDRPYVYNRFFFPFLLFKRKKKEKKKKKKSCFASLGLSTLIYIRKYLIGNVAHANAKFLLIFNTQYTYPVHTCIQKGKQIKKKQKQTTTTYSSKWLTDDFFFSWLRKGFDISSELSQM